MCEVNLILNEINELENPKPQIIVSGFCFFHFGLSIINIHIQIFKKIILFIWYTVDLGSCVDLIQILYCISDHHLFLYINDTCQVVFA